MNNKILEFFNQIEKKDQLNIKNEKDKNNINININTNINDNDNNLKYNNPWIEKYRPSNLNDIIGNEHTIERLKIIVEQGNLPNLILSGPSGVGKTTSILCLANELLGENYKEAVLELNASDARGIDVVRNKIKLFAQKKIILPYGQYKIIILDEADSMTAAAQQALRRTMEIYSNTTRFILACNTSTKIIEPIQSRCVILRYSKLSNNELKKRLLQIAEKEGIKNKLEEDGLESIIFNSDGDLRAGLNILQTTSFCYDKIISENVFKICDKPQPLVVQKIYEYCIQNKFEEAKILVSELYNKGFAASDIIILLFKIVCKPENLNLMDENKRLKIIEIITTYHQRIIYGCSSELQLFGCISSICNVDI